MLIARKPLYAPIFIITAILFACISLAIDDIIINIVFYCLSGLFVLPAIFDFLQIKKTLLYDAASESIIFRNGSVFKPKVSIYPLSSIKSTENIDMTGSDKSKTNLLYFLFGGIAAMFIALAAGSNRNTQDQGIFINFYKERPKDKPRGIHVREVFGQNRAYATLCAVLNDYRKRNNLPPLDH